MKKTISLLLALLMLVSVFSAVAAAAAETDSFNIGTEYDRAAVGDGILSKDGKYIYSILDDGTIEIGAHRYDKDGDGYPYSLRVPSAIDGYTVSSITRGAFSYTQRRLFLFSRV